MPRGNWEQQPPPEERPSSDNAPRRARPRPAAATAPSARSWPAGACPKYIVATEKVLPLWPIYDIQSGAVPFPRIASLKTAQAFRDRLSALNLTLPFDESLQSAPTSPLSRPLEAGGLTAGNRWCILPMEGWDGTPDGRPTELTTRRWRHFGLSGAKLIWGGEAVAVRAGRPGQSQPTGHPRGHGRRHRGAAPALVEAHRERFGCDRRSAGRAAAHAFRALLAPTRCGGPEPRIAYRHPVLDSRVGVTDDQAVFTDDEIDRLVDDFLVAARRRRSGRLRLCRHQALSRVSRPRAAERRHAPGQVRRLARGPHALSARGRGRHSRRGAGAGDRRAPVGLRHGAVPARTATASANRRLPTRLSLRVRRHARRRRGKYRRCRRAADVFASLGIAGSALTAGSPYYNPHIQRPAMFPPSDGYLPPEDPLVGVARQIDATARLKARHPELAIVGSAYSYLQEWRPTSRSTSCGAGMVDCRRTRADGAQLPGPAGRRPGRRADQDASCCAARSATARPARATGWSPAAIRSTRST